MQFFAKVISFVSCFCIAASLGFIISVQIPEHSEFSTFLFSYVPALLLFILGTLTYQVSQNFALILSYICAFIDAIVKNIYIQFNTIGKFRLFKYSYTFDERFSILYDDAFDYFYCKFASSY